MRSIECEGATIDDAITKALASLRVERSQVEIEILENVSRGLFGIGTKPARVRATVRAALTDTLELTPDVSQETPRTQTTLASVDARADKAREVLGAVLSHLVDDGRVSVAATGEPGSITLIVDCAESGTIIGRRGQTLDALEHVLNRVVFRDEGVAAGRVVIDVEGYRQRRQESLEQLARKLAAKARETGRSVTLNPMSPRDRRIVHLTLQNEAGVTTRSEGEGHNRKLMILPTSRSARPSGDRDRAR